MNKRLPASTDHISSAFLFDNCQISLTDRRRSDRGGRSDAGSFVTRMVKKVTKRRRHASAAEASRSRAASECNGEMMEHSEVENPVLFGILWLLFG
jgi:hypothetical protein